MKEIKLPFQHPYIETKLFLANDADLRDIFSSKNSVIIVDKQVNMSYPQLFNDYSDKTIEISNEKDIDVFAEICEQLIKLKINKSHHLIGVGGGNLSDLVGFVASVYMRGISVSFVPTTLLGMVDASIGGKTALNIGTIKNVIGTINQPKNVYYYLNFLKTLPHTEFISGFVEILKIAFLFDYELVQNCLIFLSKYKGNEFRNDMQLLSIITDAISYKVSTIENDIYDNDERNLLNFGHTIGHIIELEYGLSHGFAVANGMILETQLAMILEHTEGSTYSRIYRILRKYFSIDVNAFDLQRIIDNLVYDKKNKNGKILLPIITDIGSSKLITVTIEDFHKLIASKISPKAVMRIATIDVGSNTILMQILEIHMDGKMSVIGDYHGIARLSENLNLTHKISSEAVQRASTILSEFGERCKVSGVIHIKAVGTNALREANNASLVVKELELAFNQPNFRIDVISGEEEAELSFLGAISQQAAMDKVFTVVDIGGGSTEIIMGSKQQISRKISIPIGVVKLTEKFNIVSPIKDEKHNEIITYLHEVFSGIDISMRSEELIAVSGTPVALAAIAQNTNEHNSAKINNFTFTTAEFQRTIAKVYSMDVNKLISNFGMEKGRADVLAAGAMILEVLLAKMRNDNFKVSKNGLRFGVAIRELNNLKTTNYFQK